MRQSFMKKEITDQKDWYEIDTNEGIRFIPAEMLGDNADEATAKSHLPSSIKNIYSVEKINGFGARLSANGYTDATEWGVFETIEKANQYLDDLIDLENDNTYGDVYGEDE